MASPARPAPSTHTAPYPLLVLHYSTKSVGHRACGRRGQRDGGCWGGPFTPADVCVCVWVGGGGSGGRVSHYRGVASQQPKFICPLARPRSEQWTISSSAN